MSNVAEFEKKMREGKKFEKKETKGEKIRKILDQGKKETKGEKIRKILNQGKKDESTRTRRQQAPNPPRRVPGEQKEMIPLKSGGRAMYKSGSKGCKLAMKGKGRAYGKNS